MKKLAAAILAIIYISTSSGAAIHLHYCMGKLVKTELGDSKEDKCDNCGMKSTDLENSGCCKDEYRQIKIENDQKITEPTLQMIHSAAVEMPASFIEIFFYDFSSCTEKNIFSHALLRSDSVAIYVRNCVFLI